jgi:2-polyprenyl-3-methyl-5-hydroxy-6-metoxy-1,4-benzoquinol methylase
MIQINGLDFAAPIKVANVNDNCFFYHWMDIPDVPSVSGIKTVPGTWDLRGRFRDYTGGVDFAGKSVLDVGVATGWISFEAEKHGAIEVVGVDLPEGDRPQHVPYFS